MAPTPVHGIAGKINISIYVLGILLFQLNLNFGFFHAKYKGCQNQLDPGYNELQQICERFQI